MASPATPSPARENIEIEIEMKNLGFFFILTFMRATWGLRARGGSESLYLYGSAWFGSVWGGILGGIARVGLLRGISLPRECSPGSP